MVLVLVMLRINVTQVTLFCLMKIGWYLLLFQIMLSRWCYILFKEPSCVVLSNTAIYLNVTFKEKHISYRNSSHYVTLIKESKLFGPHRNVTQILVHTSLYLLLVKCTHRSDEENLCSVLV